MTPKIRSSSWLLPIDSQHLEWCTSSLTVQVDDENDEWKMESSLKNESSSFFSSKEDVTSILVNTQNVTSFCFCFSCGCSDDAVLVPRGLWTVYVSRQNLKNQQNSIYLSRMRDSIGRRYPHYDGRMDLFLLSSQLELFLWTLLCILFFQKIEGVQNMYRAQNDAPSHNLNAIYLQ